MSGKTTELTMVVEIAALAEGLLKRRGNFPGIGRSLIDRISATGILDIAGLDEFIFSDRHLARSKLGLKSLTETDRILSALARASKELKRG
jgi:hypothetical protein